MSRLILRIFVGTFLGTALSACATVPEASPPPHAPLLSETPKGEESGPEAAAAFMKRESPPHKNSDVADCISKGTDRKECIKATIELLQFEMKLLQEVEEPKATAGAGTVSELGTVDAMFAQLDEDPKSGPSSEPGVSLAAWDRIVETACKTDPAWCIYLIEKAYPGYFKARMPLSCQRAIDAGTSY